MKKIFFVLLTILVAFQAKAQISLGAQASYISFVDGVKIKTFGAGIKGEFAMRDRLVFTGGVDYYLASTFTDLVYANAYGNFTEPNQIKVDVEHKSSFLHFRVGAKGYFIGDYEGSFGMYGLVEAGFLLAPTTSTFEDYDTELYYTYLDDNTKETLSNPTLSLGLGGEVNVNFGYVFGEVKLVLPANQSNGTIIDIEIPPAVSISAGVRIPLN